MSGKGFRWWLSGVALVLSGMMTTAGQANPLNVPSFLEPVFVKGTKWVFSGILKEPGPPENFIDEDDVPEDYTTLGGYDGEIQAFGWEETIWTEFCEVTEVRTYFRAVASLIVKRHQYGTTCAPRTWDHLNPLAA